MAQTSDCRPAVGELNRRSSQLVQRAGIIDRTVLFEKDDFRRISTTGLPDTARLVRAGDRVWRHYIQNPQLKPVIEQSGQLESGITTFAIKRPGLFEIWPELTGIFITTPEFRSIDVGLEEGIENFVDFRLDPELLLIEIEEAYYLIPGPKRLPDWIVAAWEDYRASGDLPVDPGKRRLIEKLEKNGSPEMPMIVSISIIQQNDD